jgi:hypothetical protein
MGDLRAIFVFLTIIWWILAKVHEMLPLQAGISIVSSGTAVAGVPFAVVLAVKRSPHRVPDWLLHVFADAGASDFAGVPVVAIAPAVAGALAVAAFFQYCSKRI